MMALSLSSEAWREAEEGVHFSKVRTNKDGLRNFVCNLPHCSKPTTHFPHKDQFNLHLVGHSPFPFRFRLPDQLKEGRKGNQGTGKPSRILKDLEKITIV